MLVIPVVERAILCAALVLCMQVVAMCLIVIIWLVVSLPLEVTSMGIVTADPQILLISGVAVASIAVVVVWQRVASPPKIISIETTMGMALEAVIV